MDTYCFFLRRILVWVFFRVLCSPLPPPFSFTNSEEAKSTTWLHPVTGEAVITGHRKTPGNTGCVFSTFLRKSVHARTHASPRKGYVRVTVGKKGRQVAGRAWKTTGVDFFSAAKQQSPLSAVGPLRTASPRHPHPTYSTWTLCDTLFKSYVT